MDIATIRYASQQLTPPRTWHPSRSSNGKICPTLARTGIVPSDLTIPLDLTFAKLLSNAATVKPNDAVFLPNYAAALDVIALASDTEFHGLKLHAKAGVYTPGRNSSTDFIANNWWAAHLENGAGRSFLELGCGSGALTLFATRNGWRATGCDISETAVECARSNAQANDISAEFFQSDLFSKVGERRFQTVVFNLPYMHKTSIGEHESAIADAEGKLARRFLDEAPQYLTEDGRLVFTYSNCSDAHLLEREDWDFEMVACDYEARGRYWRLLISARPR